MTEKKDPTKDPKSIKIIADHMVDCATKMYAEMGYLDNRVREIAHRVAVAVGGGYHESPPTDSFNDTSKVTFTWKIDVGNDSLSTDCHRISYHWYQSGNWGAEWFDDNAFPVEFLYDEAKLVAFEKKTAAGKTQTKKDARERSKEEAKTTIKELQEEFPELEEERKENGQT